MIRRSGAIALATLAAAALLGCGGGGGSTSPGTFDRTAYVSTLVKKGISRDALTPVFGEQTDALLSGLAKVTEAIYAAADAEVAKGRREATRHADGLTPPSLEFWTGKQDAGNIQPIKEGPFTLQPKVTLEKWHDDDKLGLRLSGSTAADFTANNIVIHLELKVEGSSEMSFWPSPEGKVSGKEHGLIEFKATFEKDGPQSVKVRFAVDTTVTGNVADDTKLTSVDLQMEVRKQVINNSEIREDHTVTMTGGPLPPSFIGAPIPQPSDFTTTPGPNTPPDAAKLLAEVGHAAVVLLRPYSSLVYLDASKQWQGGRTVEVKHTNEDVTRALQPGDKVDVKFETRHKKDDSVVANAKYEFDRSEPIGKLIAPGHFQITIPEKGTADWNSLRDNGLTIRSTSRRGYNILRTKWQMEGLLLQNASVAEDTGELILLGKFGDKRGQVTVGGTALSIKSWTGTRIVATIPTTGAGSAGTVLVTVDQEKSNTGMLTEWTGTITYTLLGAGGLKQELEQNVRFRADVRDAAEAKTIANTLSTSDSNGEYRASGSYQATVDDCTTRMTWGGTQPLPWSAAPAASTFTFADATFDPVNRKFGLRIAAAAAALKLTRTVECPPNGPETTTEDGLRFATDYLDQLADASGLIQIPMGADYSVAAGQKSIQVPFPLIKGDEIATVSVSWSGFTAR